MTPDLWRQTKPRLVEIAETLPSACTTKGLGTKSGLLPEPWRESWSIPRFDDPLLTFSPDDQVAVAWASASVAEVQEALRPKGLCLPLPQTGCSWVDGRPGTIGGLFAMNLPHGHSNQFGSPREWLLGGAFILADGRVSKAGSTAVKSVAGYDVHRLFCGSRGSLMVMALAFLRLAPIKGVPACPARIVAAETGDWAWIQRVMPRDFEKAAARAQHLIASDEASSTLWHSAEPRRFEHDWLIGPEGLIDPSPSPGNLILRAKAAFDPTHRFNPHLTP